MDVSGFGDAVALSLGRKQQRLSTVVAQLSSGLRIQTAADDPSGLAIAEGLQTKVNGLLQGTHNIQDASNALTVADGALAQITEILQRMRTLTVQARNGLMSVDQQGEVQLEIDQLVLEINRIAQNTTFNGKALLDGSNSARPPLPARVIIFQNDTLSSGSPLVDTGAIDSNQPAAVQGGEQVTAQLTVGQMPSGDMSLTDNITSQDPNFGGPQTTQYDIAVGTNFPVGGFPPTPGNPTFTDNDVNWNPVLSYNINNLSPADVGKSAILVTLPAQDAVAGRPLEINTGDGEGSVISVSIGGMSAADLGVNEITLSGDDLANQGNQIRIDYALEQVTSARATLGAQMVSLGDAASNANISATNYQSSESNIRDVNVGSATVEYTKDQILYGVLTRVLRSTNLMQRELMLLMTYSVR